MRYLTFADLGNRLVASLGTMRGSLVSLNLMIGRSPTDFPLPVVSMSSTERQYDGALWEALEVEWWLATYPAPTTTP